MAGREPHFQPRNPAPPIGESDVRPPGRTQAGACLTPPPREAAPTRAHTQRHVRMKQTPKRVGPRTCPHASNGTQTRACALCQCRLPRDLMHVRAHVHVRAHMHVRAYPQLHARVDMPVPAHVRLPLRACARVHLHVRGNADWILQAGSQESAPASLLDRMES